MGAAEYRIALIILHSIFILRTLFLFPPINLFTLVHIPLNTPSHLLRAAFLPNIPPPLDALFTRLASSDLRTSYARFGHTVIQQCDYCRTSGEFALYALPIALLTYIREAAVVGVVTIRGSRRERFRILGLAVLVAAAVTEGYWTTTVHITLDEPVMWHDFLWTLRQVLFLLLPFVIHFLPPSPDQPASAMSSTVFMLDNMLKKIHLLKYTRGAVMRTPELRSRAGQWWEEERRRGDYVRSDEAVGRVAEKEGLGFREPEGKLRGTAKAAVQILSGGFTPSQYWKPST